MRRLYFLLLRLHPRSFRERFADEMMAIFDEAGSIALLGDVLASLIRQRLFRPHRQPVTAGLATPAGGMFSSVDTYKPRWIALVQGALLSAVLFWLTAFAATESEHPFRLIGISPSPRSGSLVVGDLSASAAMQRVPAPAADPWRDFATHYFRFIYVLSALDANHDYVISADEISSAVDSLRQLDQDGDGKLTAEEAGMCLGAGSSPGCRGENTVGEEHGRMEWSPDQMERFRAVFMGANPVLAALDTDHDREISAREIRNAPAALKRLDLNGDGQLLPVEIAPESEARRILLNQR